MINPRAAKIIKRIKKEAQTSASFWGYNALFVSVLVLTKKRRKDLWGWYEKVKFKCDWYARNYGNLGIEAFKDKRGDLCPVSLPEVHTWRKAYWIYAKLEDLKPAHGQL